MIIGQVNHRNEAIISVQIGDSGGQIMTLDTVIDTGFSGYLSLPPSAIAAMQLPYIETQAYSLGNNTRVDLDLLRRNSSLGWAGQGYSRAGIRSTSTPGHVHVERFPYLYRRC